MNSYIWADGWTADMTVIYADSIKESEKKLKFILDNIIYEISCINFKWDTTTNPEQGYYW